MTARREQSRPEKVTRQQKGREFEEQVARWLRTQFSKYKPTVLTNQFANGQTVNRPYQIDVHAHFTTGTLFRQEHDVWVECKWKEQSSVKRTDVIKLVSSAQDVFQACQIGRNSIYFDGLMLVTNQRFDVDAFNCARQHDVLCIRYDGKRYQQQFEIENWLDEPAWLKRIA